MNFLPENYEAPKSSGFYLKLQEGENRIRILSEAVIGWEDWIDKKPVRFRMNNKPLKSFDPKKPVKHFWAFVVYNHNEDQIQIMQITQSSIRKSLESLCKDGDWGAPYFYDIKIMKTGDGIDTEYAVNPVPHKPIDQSILDRFHERKCNLEALFDNADPFSPEWEMHTRLGFSKVENIKDNAEIELLKTMLDQCDPEYKENLMHTLSKMPTPVTRLEDVPVNLMPKIKTAIKKKHEEYNRMAAV